MAANLERLAKEWAEKGYPQMEEYLNAGAKKARQLGAPESFSVESQLAKTETIKIYPEISLEEEWNRQSQNLAALFVKELGLTNEQYIASLPKFELQPKEYKGRLDIPVIVETRVPLEKMLKLVGINKYFNVGLIKEWEKDKFETPKTPYTTWLNDSSINLNKSVDTVRKGLKSDERGGTVFDGIALYLRDPKILEHHFLDLPGSQVVSGRAPYLNRWNEQPRLNHFWTAHASPNGGSVVAGRKIKV